MKINNYRDVNKGCMLSSFDVIIPTLELSINCTLFEKDGQKWISLPSRQYEVDGMKKYFSLVRFSKEKHAKFQDKVLSMIDNGEYEKYVPQEDPRSVFRDEDEVPF